MDGATVCLVGGGVVVVVVVRGGGVGGGLARRRSLLHDWLRGRSAGARAHTSRFGVVSPRPVPVQTQTRGLAFGLGE